MNGTFVDVVEDVKRLSTEEKQELKDLLDNYLVEERRNEILENYERSKSEAPKFCVDINELKDSLND
jgi:hypothetical protein